MGCVSSKLLKKEIKRELLVGGGGDYANHVVSLTSSTYGFLNKLDNHNNSNQPNRNQPPPKQGNESQQQQHLHKATEGATENKERCVVGIKRSSPSPSPKANPSPRKDPEVINAWELMGDLVEEEVSEGGDDQKKLVSQKSVNSIGNGNKLVAVKTPLKQSLNQTEKQGTTPKGNVNKIDGKENCKSAGGQSNSRNGPSIITPSNKVLKLWNNADNPRKSLSTSRISRKSSGSGSLDLTNNNSKSSNNGSAVNIDGSGLRNGSSSGRRRRSLTPLFDPDLIQTFEKDLSLEQEQIKKIITSNSPTTTTTTRSRSQSQKRYSSSPSILKNYELKCPPGGENCVVIYTTTLRGIRKTFEDCNVVRSLLESCQVQFIERDISMDSGFKEELRKLIGKKVFKVPLCFVKGRLIGGADELFKLEEEGKLWGLLDGIEKRDGRSVCDGCGGIRFVMCMECNGSCKVLDANGDEMIRCGMCNENGLIHCPICS